MNTGAFLDLMFGPLEGWVAMATFPGDGIFDPDPAKGPTAQTFFHWPSQRSDINIYVLSKRHQDVYFSPTLYAEAGSRAAANAKAGQYVYADGDGCPPDALTLKPTITVQTSPGSRHYYWKIADCTDPYALAQMGRALAHQHAGQGCDKSGWAVGKLLRMPNSHNNKPTLSVPFSVQVAHFDKSLAYDREFFSSRYDPASVPSSTQVKVEMPDESTLPSLEEAREWLIGMDDEMAMIDEPVGPRGDRSKRMWYLLGSLSRNGVDIGSAFVLARSAKCNKYAADGRPEHLLWQEVVKAFDDPANKPPETDADFEHLEVVLDARFTAEIEDPQAVRFAGVEQTFLSDAERQLVPMDTFVDRFQKWGSSRTDAATQYLRAAALTCMSAVYGEFGKPATRFDSGYLNLWFLILGGTTRSRKSTVRGMMVDMLAQISDNTYTYDIGSNATTEGLMNELIERPFLSSVFHRDEVHGLLYEVGAKGYMAGFVEALTELYDGRVQGKLRATGSIKRSAGTRTVFVMFLAGVTDHVTTALTAADFASGFLARFLFVHADPPVRTRETERMEQKEEMVSNSGDDVFQNLCDELRLGRSMWESATGGRGKQIEIRFTDEAWERVNDFVWDAGNAASQHELNEILLPTVDRMTKSVIKVAILLAMHDSQFEVSLRHTLKAIAFAEEWYSYLTVVAAKVRKNRWLGLQDDVEQILAEYGGEAPHGKIYQRMRSKIKIREFDEVLEALNRAGRIKQTIRGQARVYILNGGRG